MPRSIRASATGDAMTDIAGTNQLPDQNLEAGVRPVLRKLLAKFPARISLAILVVATLCALFPQTIAPHDPFAQDLTRRLLPPVWGERGVWENLLGTDQLGRDVLSRIIEGAQLTLFVSLFAVIVSCIVGVAAGLVAGYNGGWTDAVILRLIDMQLAFPLILLVIAVVAVVGPSLGNLIIIMGLSGWPRFARIVRGSVLAVRSLEFVEAARSIGASRMRIMLRHILPNVLSAIIVYASFELARMILLESTLSFLGLGVQPPAPTWGSMISDGRKYLAQSWIVSLAPGVAIAAIILAFNILGDELRDALDPQLDDRL
jgi:ABC-type dipeptide/oligopeptide/nickel transport system permease subunit